jgi:hypothetical protein
VPYTRTQQTAIADTKKQQNQNEHLNQNRKTKNKQIKATLESTDFFITLTSLLGTSSLCCPEFTPEFLVVMSHSAGSLRVCEDWELELEAFDISLDMILHPPRPVAQTEDCKISKPKKVRYFGDVACLNDDTLHWSPKKLTKKQKQRRGDKDATFEDVFKGVDFLDTLLAAAQ